MIEMRKLGRTGIEVSSICLGTMTFGQQNTEAEGHAQMDRAVDAGINFLDTAEMYSIPPKAETQGSTERIVGSWLAARGNRDRIVLATKVSGRSTADWLRPNGKGARLDEANIRYALERSLERLRTDYVDLYQLHWPDRKIGLFGDGGTTYAGLPADDDAVPIEDTLGALDRLVQEGKIRHVGLSNETAWGVSRFLHLAETGRGPRMASIQNVYSLVSRTFEIGLAEMALREDVGLLAYSRSDKATSPASTSAERGRRARERRYSNAASAMRSPASKRRSTPTSSLLPSTASTPCILRWPS